MIREIIFEVSVRSHLTGKVGSAFVRYEISGDPGALLREVEAGARRALADLAGLDADLPEPDPE